MNDIWFYLFTALMVVVFAFILITRARWQRYNAKPVTVALSRSPRLRQNDRVVLVKDSNYLRDYHGAVPGTVGTIIGEFSGTSPGEPDSTCMVKWDSSDSPVRCSFDEIMTVSRALERHVHVHARKQYGEGPDAVSRRVGFENGAAYLSSRLPQEQLEQLVRSLGPVPEFETAHEDEA